MPSSPAERGSGLEMHPMDSLGHGMCWDGRWDSLPTGAALSQITKSQQQAEDHVANMMQFRNSGVIFVITNI